MSSEDIKQLMNQGTEQAKALLIQEYMKQVHNKDVDIENIDSAAIYYWWQSALEWCHKILGTVIVTGELKRYRLVKQ